MAFAAGPWPAKTEFSGPASARAAKRQAALQPKKHLKGKEYFSMSDPFEKGLAFGTEARLHADSGRNWKAFQPQIKSACKNHPSTRVPLRFAIICRLSIIVQDGGQDKRCATICDIMTAEAISRRNFIASSAAMIAIHAVPAQASAAPFTAGEVLERIRNHVDMPWLSPTMKTTVDNIVGGDASTPVKGIATTTMATIEVLRQALAGGFNMVISHETPYYLHIDKTDDIKGDATLEYKLDFIRKNNIAILHLHDHWHHRSPDSIATGMVKEMGWQKFVDSRDPKKFTFPGQSLEHFTKGLQEKLQLRCIRVVGHPSMQVSSVYANWGYVKRELGIQLLSRPDVDTLVTGETVEWELVPYVQDTIASGQKKALVLLGHVNSENGGMRYCAEWLRDFITEVPIGFVPAPEPFWNPISPTS